MTGRVRADGPVLEYHELKKVRTTACFSRLPYLRTLFNFLTMAWISCYCGYDKVYKT